jgi:GDP-L-fucose synthase
MKNIIITGGTGMVGSAFKGLYPESDYPTRHQLTVICGSEFKKYHFEKKTIIHLAAKVGGVKANMEQVADFYLENAKLNQAVLSSAALGGAKKVISLLSTCIYPDKPYITYPLTEDQLHLGPPHHSNFGYAYAKRMVDVMSRAYRQQYGCNFITAIPNNLYGRNDNFDLENGHVIPSLIRKVWEAKLDKIWKFIKPFSV